MAEPLSPQRRSATRQRARLRGQEARQGRALWVYDVTTNTGFVSVGITSDTGEFAAQLGRQRYPGVRELTVTADCGGSNGGSCRSARLRRQLPLRARPQSHKKSFRVTAEGYLEIMDAVGTCVSSLLATTAARARAIACASTWIGSSALPAEWFMKARGGNAGGWDDCPDRLGFPQAVPEGARRSVQADFAAVREGRLS
jgi:hypothetical protein